MQDRGLALWPTLLLTVLCGHLAASTALRSQPTPVRPASTHDNLLRLVLQFNFADPGNGRSVTARLMDVTEKRGLRPDQDRMESQVKHLSREIGENRITPMRYRVFATNGDGQQEIGRGYFVVDRRVHSERLDPEDGSIVERFDGRSDLVTQRLYIPDDPRGETLVLEEITLREGALDESRSIEILREPGFRSTSASLLNLTDTLADPANPYDLIAGSGHPGNFNIVFLGDGFTKEPTSIGFYRQQVDQHTETIFGSHPFGAFSSSINIYRVDVVSLEENGLEHPGVEARDPEPQFDPAHCPDTPRSNELRPNTLETHLCGKVGVNRKFWFINATAAGALKIAQYAGLIPYPDNYTIVLVNDRDFAGAGFSGSRTAFASVTSSLGGAPPDCDALGPFECSTGGALEETCAGFCDYESAEWRERLSAMVVHEFGHAAFDLGDEYCVKNQTQSPWHCVPREEGCTEPYCQYTGVEPTAWNVTGNLGSVGTEKPGWDSLAQASGLPKPTHRVPGCDPEFENTPQDPPILAPDLVGFFEGAAEQGTKYLCGLFRPQHECKMNSTYQVPFCPVCRDAILRRLEPYSEPGVDVILDSVTVKAPLNNVIAANLRYQALVKWVPGNLGTQPLSPELHQELSAEEERAVPAGADFGGDRFFLLNTRLRRLNLWVADPPPRIAVHLRVLAPGDLEVAVGSCFVDSTTGVHIADRDQYRCTVSVVGDPP